MKYMSLKELCQELSISIATGRNWIRLGKLIPEYTEDKIPYFTTAYVGRLRRELADGTNHALKSRRNKKFISGNALYRSYVSETCQNLSLFQRLLSLISEEDISLDTDTIQLLVAHCALHLFASKCGEVFDKSENLLINFITYDNIQNPLISDLMGDPQKALDFCRRHPALFSLDYVYEDGEDILGLIYISCKNLGNRKAAGAYFTPTKVVRELTGLLDFHANTRILDPCCGTGNFLLQLPEDITFAQVYGCDVDPVAVKIARINMALKFEVTADIAREHIALKNFLSSQEHRRFDIILGNPPWGYDFSESERLSLKKDFKTAQGANVESYDLFVEKSLRLLAPCGHVAFVLPEAILSVKSHRGVREIILENCSIRNLHYLGDVFQGVQCPCVILDVSYTGKDDSMKLCGATTGHRVQQTTEIQEAPKIQEIYTASGIHVKTPEKEFTIREDRPVTPENLNFKATDEEFQLINRIKSNPGNVYLAGNADFALGIVTGDNKTFVSQVKTQHNERILKGSDISPFHINPSDNYVTFAPEKFQQTAPERMYRAPEKLVYRFISDRLIFAYDDRQTLTLNSCNILIPRISGLDMRYVMAVLNSSVANFIYQKEYNSVKVLRSHLEKIPIPFADTATQHRVIHLAERLSSDTDPSQYEKDFAELNGLMAELYQVPCQVPDTICQFSVPDTENRGPGA